MIKCIVCDLDGTLIREDDTIEKQTLKKLRQHIDNGVEFIIATGRSMRMVEDIVVNYGFDCDMVLNNGAQFYSSKTGRNEIYPMNYEALKQIIPVLHDYDYLLAIHTDQGIYSLKDRKAFWEHHLKLLMKRRGTLDGLPQKTFTVEHEYLKDFSYIKSVEEMVNDGAKVLKIDARHLDENSVKGVRQQLGLDDLFISSSYEDNIEITSNLSSKERMLQTVIAEKGYHPDEVAVFGDGDNDCGMLAAFNYSFTPSNACEEATAVAKILLNKTNVDGAVAEGLQMLEAMKLL